MKFQCNGMRPGRLVLAVVLTTLWFAGFAVGQNQIVPGSIFKAQNVPLTQGMLGVGVSADSPTDVWVVGISSLHFDGKKWTQISTGNPNLILNSVVALSPNDVWAAGSFQNNQGFDVEVVKHFDGKAWRNVQDLSLVGKKVAGQVVLGEVLRSITGPSSNDLWAGGYLVTDNNGGRSVVPFVERFDGKKWRVSGTSFGIANSVTAAVNGISVLSDSDAWMVVMRDINGQADTGAAFHFDGTKWKMVRTPVVSNSIPTAVVAVSHNDVWAVGYKNSPHATLVEHFDGKAWTVVPSPTPTGTDNVDLAGVSAISSTDAWASGFQHSVLSGNNEPLVLHWNGSKWTIVPAPGRTGQSTTMFGVATLASGDVWVAGTFLGTGNQKTFEPYVLFTDQGR